MQKIISLLLTGFLFWQFNAKEGNDTIPVNNTNNYSKGEHLELKMRYGIFTVGKGYIDVSKELYSINGSVCHKINVYGKSANHFDFMYNVRDTWRSYIDTATSLPKKSFRDIKEGKFTMKEEIYYNYNTQKALVNKLDNNDNLKKDTFPIPGPVQDIVSGFYYLRSIDYKRLSPGDIIEQKAFFEDTVYNVKIKYKGEETVDVKVGEFNAYKLSPVLPQNDLFKGQEPVTLWISADKNKIPLKAQAKLFLGSVKLELTKYKNLTHPLNSRK